MPTIVEQLGCFAPNGQIEKDDLRFVRWAIGDLQNQGWTNDEIVSKLRWLEHVDPTVEEDVALRKMREVDRRVERRMKGEY
jgi:hypothetical protein